MTFHKAKEEYKWKQWKEQEEKILRESGVSEEVTKESGNWIGRILMRIEGFGNIFLPTRKNYIRKRRKKKLQLH